MKENEGKRRKRRKKLQWEIVQYIGEVGKAKEIRGIVGGKVEKRWKGERGLIERKTEGRIDGKGRGREKEEGKKQRREVGGEKD